MSPKELISLQVAVMLSKSIASIGIDIQNHQNFINNFLTARTDIMELSSSPVAFQLHSKHKKPRVPEFIKNSDILDFTVASVLLAICRLVVFSRTLINPDFFE